MEYCAEHLNVRRIRNVDIILLWWYRHRQVDVGGCVRTEVGKLHIIIIITSYYDRLYTKVGQVLGLIPISLPCKNSHNSLRYSLRHY